MAWVVIANLKGVPGDAAALEILSVTPKFQGALPDGADFNTYVTMAHRGTWRFEGGKSYVNAPWGNGPAPSSGFLEVQATQTPLTTVQKTTGTDDLCWRTYNRVSGTAGQWNAALTSRPAPLGMLSRAAASQAILDLARRDGWTAVYDPTNPMTPAASNGEVTRLVDSLGTGLDLVAHTGFEGVLRRGEFGMLSGISSLPGVAGSSFRQTLNLPISGGVAVMFLAQASGFTNATEYLATANVGSTSLNPVVRGTSTKAFGLSQGVGTDKIRDSKPHIFTTLHTGQNIELMVDGQYAAILKNNGLGSNLTAFSLGGSALGTAHFTGTFGPALIHTGNPSRAVIDRMERLLRALAGLEKGPHLLSPNCVAYNVSESGAVSVQHGSQGYIHGAGIASMTKMMTWLTVKTVFTDAQINSTLGTYVEGDDQGTTGFAPGDTATLIDWMWGGLGPSWDAPNNIAARTAGEKLLTDEGQPVTAELARARFLKEMNDLWQSWGYVSRPFTAFTYAATLSPVEIVDLLKRASKDSQMGPMMATTSKTINITGPNPRTPTSSHTIVSGNPWAFPEWAGGKTGTGNGFAHVATMWTNPVDGEKQYTVVVGTDADDPATRYYELRKIMVATMSSGPNNGLYESSRPDIGNGLKTTGELDLTGPAGGTVEELGQGLFVIRRGDEMTLTFRDVALPADHAALNVIQYSLRPEQFEYGEVTSYSGSTVKTVQVRITPNGTINVYGNAAGDVLRGSVRWRTRLGWPTSL